MLVVAFGQVACGNSDVGRNAIENAATAGGDVSAAGADQTAVYDATVTQPGSPFRISYRIIGTPIVGSPVTIGLRVQSLQGRGPLTLDYRINDASSMTFPEAQLLSVQLEPLADENYVVQQVTVVPQRAGRLFLNVSASLQNEVGSMSTLAAIPIQVASAGRPAELEGDLQFEGDGEAGAE